MMKAVKWIWILGAVLLTFTACESDQLEEISELEEQQDVAEMTDLELEDDDFVMGIVIDGQQFGSSDCPEVTHSAPPGTYPQTITINFGDSCTGPRGHVRSGMIVVEVSAPRDVAGSTRTMTYLDYFIDGIKMEGTRTVVFEGSDALGQAFWTYTVSGGAMIFPDGSEHNWESDFVRTQIEGSGTDLRGDDVFEITGSRWGNARNGVDFSDTIAVPLVLKADCPWIVSGVVEHERNGQLSQIDFGPGDCDRLAEVTLPDGSTRNIRLRPKKRR